MKIELEKENIKFLRVASDTHVEHRGFTFKSNPNKARAVVEKVFPKDDRDSESILVLAGDIGSHLHIELLLEELIPRFPFVIYVPGNHEFYGSSIEEVDEHYRDTQAKNLKVGLARPGDNVEIRLTLSGRKFQILACTLWAEGSNFPGPAYDSLREYMSDFRAIKYKGELFTPSDMFELNARDSIWLSKTLEEDGLTNIVITHHLPSHSLIDSRYAGQLSNYGFASNQEFLFPYVDLWIYGHTHHQKDDVRDRTRFISNALGYPTEFCEYGFDPKLFIPLSGIPVKSIRMVQ